MESEYYKLYLKINNLINTSNSDNGGVVCELWPTGIKEKDFVFIDTGLGIYNDTVTYQKELFLDQSIKLMISLKIEIDKIGELDNFKNINYSKIDDDMDDIN
jgi:hypothetical protein